MAIDGVKDFALKAGLKFLSMLFLLLGLILVIQPIATWLVSKQINPWFLGVVALSLFVFIEFKYIRGDED